MDKTQRLARTVMAGVITLASAGTARAADVNLPTFKTDVDVVNLDVAVLDGQNRFVTGLDPKDFEIYEDGIRQQVAMFAKERVPLSLAILLDTSSSMDPKLPTAQAAALRLVKALGTEDEAEVIGFNHHIQCLQTVTRDKGALEAAIRATRAEGATGLYNALYVALRELQRNSRPEEVRRRAIVVLSDGEDTTSKITDDQVLELARKVGVGVYPINLRSTTSDPRSLQGSTMTFFMTALGRDTGGQSHFPKQIADLDSVYDRIAEELHSRYSIGYVPTNPNRDGTFRRIVIRALRTATQVRHRVGYYAPRS